MDSRSSLLPINSSGDPEMNFQPAIVPHEYPQSVGESIGSQAFPATDLLKIVRRRLAFIVGTIVLVAGLGTLVTFQLTPKYRAEAVLILDSRKEQVTNIQDVMSGLPTDNSALRSQLDVLLSRPLASKVIDKLNLMSDPEFNPALAPPSALIGPLLFWLDESTQQSIDGWLHAVFRPTDENAGKTRQEIEQAARTLVIDTYLDKLLVTTDGRSLTIKLAVDSTRPDLAAKIVNTHGDLYLFDQLEAKFEATKRANTWLTERVADLKEQVRKAENAVEAYRQANQIVSSDRGATVISQQLAELNTALVVARTDRDQAEARLKQVRSLLKANSSVDSIPEVLASNTILQLRAQEGQLVQNEAQLASRYRDTHPTLINARAQLRDVRAQIRSEINKIVVSLEQAADTALNKEKSLQSAVTELTNKVSSMSVSEVQLRELEREADASRTLFQNFLGRYKETSAGPSVETSDARVVSPADPPLKPNFPKKMIFLPASLILGVIIAFGLTALLELMDNGFRSADQIESASGVAGLGMLPNLPVRLLSSVHPTDFVVKKPLSSFAEAIRAVRTSLFFSNVDAPPKVILITSSVPAEGKTILSVSLARSAAMSGHKTMLLDADFRRPAVAAGLGAGKVEATVADYVAGKFDLDGIIRRDEATDLDFIAAPSGVTNPLDLISSRQFANMLDALRERYEFVFIDSPPILAVADPLALARMADTVVFSVRWEKTPQQVVLGALKSLQAAGATVAGSVLSRVNVKRHMRYGYGDRGYYYGRYGTYYTK
jgi:polysaccharide biosynthesis transport protein